MSNPGLRLLAFAWLVTCFSAQGQHDRGETSVTTVSSGALATAPPTVSVTGLRCHPSANNVAYRLQPVPVNGRPHYATADGRWNLYWTPQSPLSGSASWLIDTETSQSADPLAPVPDISLVSEAPPFGSAMWIEFCDNDLTQVRLQLSEHYPKDWCMGALQALAPMLTATCCAEDGLGCGTHGVVPNACSIDCASLWAPFSTQCPDALDLGSTELTSFFAHECSAVASSLAVSEQSPTLAPGATFDVVFSARSGTRYLVDIRVGAAGSGHSEPCADNLYESLMGVPGACVGMIASGGSTGDAHRTCAVDMCAECGQFAHACDHACGFSCTDDGITSTLLNVLAPAATDTRRAVASDISALADKGLGFTATVTGDFTARVDTTRGHGTVNLSIQTIGTALERSTHVLADGQPHPMSVSCRLSHCAFGYDGAAIYDGDGSGYDLVIPDAEAGRAYAVLVELPVGQTAAQIKATFYQAGAATGAAAFEPVVEGPLGSWSSTPPGHQSWAEQLGCQNNDRICAGAHLRTSFGYHPGGEFGSILKGTWVSPTSGPTLLRIVVNCDVVFYSDVQALGCHVDGTEYDCHTMSDGKITIENNRCASLLQLTVTPGAFFNPDDVSATVPVLGTVTRTDTLSISRADIEAQVAALWQAIPASQRVTATAPTMEEMLVAGTEANEMLNTLFFNAQQPTVVFPLTIEPQGGGHRRLQKGGDQLRVAVEAHAPAPDIAQQVVSRLSSTYSGVVEAVQSHTGKGRRLQTGGDELAHELEQHVCGLGSTALGCTVTGQTRLHAVLILPSQEVEDAVRDKFEATPPEQRTLLAPPSLDDSLVGGTEANVMLASAFVKEQQPQVSSAVRFERNAGGTSLVCGHGRRTQADGDELYVTVETHAATPVEADRAVRLLATRTGSMTCASAPAGKG